jgi:hypothetical protein
MCGALYLLQTVAMTDPSPLPSKSPSPAIPPSSGLQTRSKGKAREVRTNAGAPPVKSTYGLRGTNKRPAEPDAPVDAVNNEGEITPRKPDASSNQDIPHVRVDDASPPPPTRCARTELAPLVATNDVGSSASSWMSMGTYRSYRTGVGHA